MQISFRGLFARLENGVATTRAAFSTGAVRTLTTCLFVVILLASVPAFAGLTYGMFGVLSYWNTCVVHREKIDSVAEMYEIFYELEQTTIDPLKYGFYLGSWKCNPGEGIRNWFSEKSASAYMKRGDANFSKTDYDVAIGDYNIAIDIDPSNAEAYVNRGIAYFTESNYDKAISDETKAIEIKPEKNALAYYYLGVAYSLKGDYAHGNDESLRYYDKAIEAQTKVVEIDPNNVAAYYNRGYDLIKRGNYDMAIVDETKVIDLAPKDARGYFNRGVAYGQKGDYDEAIADETKAIEIDPSNANTYLSRGVAYLGKRDYDRAILDEIKAIEIDPANNLAYCNLSAAYSGTGNSGDNIKALEAQLMCSRIDPSGMMRNGLDHIGPDHKSLHSRFSSDPIGYLFAYYEKGILLPIFWRGTNYGVEKTAVFFQSSRVVRVFLIVLYFILFVFVFELGRHIVVELVYKNIKRFILWMKVVLFRNVVS